MKRLALLLLVALSGCSTAGIRKEVKGMNKQLTLLRSEMLECTRFCYGELLRIRKHHEVWWREFQLWNTPPEPERMPWEEEDEKPDEPF